MANETSPPRLRAPQPGDIGWVAGVFSVTTLAVRPFVGRFVDGWGRRLFVIAGVANYATNDGHVLRSDDGKTALWFGNIDDLWRMGVPTGAPTPNRSSPV